MSITFAAPAGAADKKNQAVSAAPAESTMERVNNFLLKFSGVPSSEKLFFVQHLGVMLKAGVSLLAALQTLSKQSESPRLAKILKDVAVNVEKGKTLTDSFRPHVSIFGELFINMIDAGEVSGKLESVLEQLYMQMKKQHQLMSRVKGALTYPLVILFAMCGIGIFMVVVVVPQITAMLKDFNSELPLATKILIGVSDSIANNGLLWGGGFILFVIIVVKTLSTRAGKYYFQAVTLRLPVFGSIIKKINLAKFARNISALLKTDIMIIKSFQITGNVLGNLHYRAAILDMAEKIKKGGTIYDVICTYPNLFPPIVTQMVAIGEQTGELDSILQQLAEFYEDEVDQIMQNLPSVIEPLLILVMGVGVGGMAIAIIMPMYSITSSI